MQPEISPDELQDWDFNTLVRRVIDLRSRNPRFNLATDGVTVANEVDEYNARRMQRLKGGENYIQDGGTITDTGPKWVAPRKGLLGVVGGVKQVAAGVATLLDWLGSGAEPVLNEIAEQRAGVCAGCPQNQDGDFFAIFTQPVAEKITTQLQIRKSMNLTTTHDAALKVCQACMCPLKLKVHVPMQHITDHLHQRVMDKLDPRCWILLEMKTN